MPCNALLFGVEIIETIFQKRSPDVCPGFRCRLYRNPSSSAPGKAKASALLLIEYVEISCHRLFRQGQNNEMIFGFAN